MHLFKTEMLRFHPPQTGRYATGLRSRRPRYGCRSVQPAPSTHALAAAVRAVLVAPSPLPASLPAAQAASPAAGFDTTAKAA